MNPILLYEQGYIPFSTLQDLLWDFGPNSIFEVGEKCFAFYCCRANKFIDYDFYIRNYATSINDDNEWFID